MTTKDSPTAENEALAKKVGGLEQEFAALKVALRRGRRMRLLLMLAVLAFVGIAVWMFYDLAMQFKSKENIDRLTAKAQERIDQSAGPAQREFQGLVEHCTPVLTEAFRKRAETDMPKYTQVVTEQRDILITNLEVELNKKLVARYEKVSEKYQGILQEEFPEIKDPELMVEVYACLDLTMQKLVEKYYSEQLQREVKALSNSWEQFEMAEPPGKGDPPLEQQFLAALLLVAADKLDADSAL